MSKQWQNKLENACKSMQIPPPKFHVVSDRRGGRTAWSARVEINGQFIDARFWFDGKNLENAKEDAAEVALNRMIATRLPSSASSRGSLW
ncbi:hypothetical protein SMACR_03440 [Sordaria macrospora]|uniref:WGS project CABT00000000 data, contig 2.10 n=2 Tax=Sordaria macrospora TaxID=5147 RepID=F7VW62_SORMK|nr:uncharacterized protein SMAC_03440 [Sordaria macrospora k-hell]KAA8630450.1 hypothetical protein SMACR_03440 [Sordaria macrospora]KAH7629904.1 hypothetical protein B0T09DRAFT_138784 [Sordaria sp. MPI-SDFR-AT-0083]WPJ66599.1 hypothetical protein SMAC4_03440 [Sordaria macrospora]CCC09884.1 unnamed protein product [Sordaria macrospora k-hell]